MSSFQTLSDFLAIVCPYMMLFLGAFLLGHILTPAMRKVSIALGMVDKPSPRRINKTPIPRAGGVAIFLAVAISTSIYTIATDHPPAVGMTIQDHWLFTALSAAIVAVGFLDDKFSLPPLAKLAGQIAVAAAAHFFLGVGIGNVVPNIPVWLDAILAIFWITGAINAFNLIDGLDGLATGLALIGFTGVAGALLFAGLPGAIPVYCAFAGASIAFLRFNFHPASIFLGDTGSMFLGFALATLPLKTGGGDSLFLSLAVPLLAMGVPIFDTLLAIIRRTIRAALKKQEHGRDVGNTKLMTADTDHLHHRILRRVGSQKTAAWTLYLMAIFLVVVAMGGVLLQNRASGLFVLAFLSAVVVVMKDMERIELWDAGMILKNAASRKDLQTFRRRRLLRVPLSVTFDFITLAIAWLVAAAISMPADIGIFEIKRLFPLYAVPVFLAMIALGTYRIVWNRASSSDFMRLLGASFFGSGISAAAAIFFDVAVPRIASFTVIFFTMSALGLIWWRLLRGIVREAFYALGRIRLMDSPDAERILVYGAGIRFRSYRRELVRATGDDSKRVIVGILDDDILLKNHFICSERVVGTLRDAPEAISRLKIDTVVITCLMENTHLQHVIDKLKQTGVKVRIWDCREIPA